MRRIQQSVDKFKKISKRDIIYFYEQLINDQNIIGSDDFRIDITSASYVKSEPNKLMKRLRIKFILARKGQPKRYYFFENYRAKDWSCVNSGLTHINTNIKN